MLLEPSVVPESGAVAELPTIEPASRRWGVDSEYGRLLDVLLSPPPHLEILPCNSVAIDAIAQGLACCRDAAASEHDALVKSLEDAGVRCHLVPPIESLPDLSFTRDSVLMTPWGLLELAPAVAHRSGEASHVRSIAEAWGIPILGGIAEGHAEGGDIAIVRPGLVVIGHSGERTDLAGARSVAGLFNRRGWTSLLYEFDPHFLHLDTQFAMVDRNLAVACAEILDGAFLDRIGALGIEIVPVSYGEVMRLGGNLLSLGDRRILSPRGNDRLNRELARRDYEIIEVELGQFIRCGGGVHCLTMPLSRLPG